MVTIVKHEWHQCDVQYAIEFDEDLLSKIYPDLDEDEIAEKLQQIENNDIDIEDIVNDAWEQSIDIDWEHQYDNMWTMTKGGYDVTYEIGDDSSWHSTPEDEPPTHKCTNCKWEGSEYEGTYVWEDENGNELDQPKKVCKYCDSDIELTEYGIKEQMEREERWAKYNLKDSLDEEIDGDEIECDSCGKMVSNDELVEREGQKHCPYCHEDWNG